MLDARTNRSVRSEATSPTTTPRPRRPVRAVIGTALAVPLAMVLPIGAEASASAARSAHRPLPASEVAMPEQHAAPAAGVIAGRHGATANLERATQVAAAGQTKAQRVVQLVNRRRRNHGRRALRMVPKVWRVAMWQSRHQAQIDRMTHRGPAGGDCGDRLRFAGYPYRKWGEAVAMGYRWPRPLVRAWMRSASHRPILLMRGVRHIGVSLRVSRDGTAYWTLVVADRR